MGFLKCWATKNILDLYVDSRLSETAADKVSKHIDNCKECFNAAEALIPIAPNMAGKIEVPAGLTESILEKLEESKQPSEEPALSLRELLQLTPAQGLALLYMLALFIGHALPGIPSQAHATHKPTQERAR